uniref:Uncharacterized protein n=1 Tax=Anopheles epiroticus TaxID=199890 RepID=A0A182P225_9DIPT
MDKGEPRPDFALDRTLFGTGRVLGAINDTQLVVAEINSRLYITLNSSYPLLDTVYGVIRGLGSSVSTLLDGVLNPLETLAPTDDSDEVELFDDIEQAIESLRMFTTVQLVTANNDLRMALGVFLPAQLEDVFGRVGDGLQELNNALLALKTAITAILNFSSEESGECPPKPIRPKLVYRVVYAVRTLKAYLPAVTYTLTTTVENIAKADLFLVRLAEETEDVQDPDQYVDLVLATTNVVASAVATTMLEVVGRLGSVTSSISMLTNITSLMEYSQVEAVLSSFETVLMRINAAEGMFNASLVDIATELTSVLTPDADTPTVDNAEVVATLVTTLVAGGPYARFCFYKYSELLFGLANTGLIGVEQCISREMMNLQQVRALMQQQAALLLLDLNGYLEELAKCNRVPTASKRGNCVGEVVTYYMSIETSFGQILDNLYSTGAAGANGVKNRLAACVAVLEFTVGDEAASSLNAEILECAANGPEVIEN